MNLQSLLEAINYASDNPKANPEIVRKFADVDAKTRTWYIGQWADKKGIKSDDAMHMAGYVQDGYIGAGAWNWRYVGMDDDNIEEKAPSDAIYGIFADGKDVTARYSSLSDAKKAAEELQQRSPKVKYTVKKADPENIEEAEEDPWDRHMRQMAPINKAKGHLPYVNADPINKAKGLNKCVDCGRMEKDCECPGHDHANEEIDMTNDLNEIEQKMMGAPDYNPARGGYTNNMIGEPDGYYDAEERQEAYDQLQDALAQSNSVEAEYVKDGHCPECPNVEDNEDCYGFGNYGCDDGELTYDGDTVSWKAIKDHDESQAQRQQAKDNYPGDEAVIDFAASTAKQLKKSGQDPRDTLQYVNQEYPNLGRAQRASLVAKGMKKAGLTTEDQVPFLQRSNSGYKKAVDDFKKLNPGKTEEDFKELGTKQQEKYLDKYLEGKSPHKKGSAKYKNHMAAKHASMGENMNENKWKEIETTSDYMLPVTMDNRPLDWPTYWEWEQSHGETKKNRASLRFSNYVKNAKHELGIAEGEQHGNSKIYKKCWTGYSKVPGKKAGEKGSCKKNEGRIEDTFGTDTVDKHDKPKKKKKEESIQVGDELMIETADGEGIVVPVLHVVNENILIGWDELAEDIVVEGARQLAELKKLAGLDQLNEITDASAKEVIMQIINSYGKDVDLETEFRNYFPRLSDKEVDYYLKGYKKPELKLVKNEAEYQGRKVKLGKPTRGDVKKFKVYVKDPKTGNVKKVNFGHGGTSAKKAGQKTMKIKKSNPARRKSFRARHNCDNPGPRTKARYWSCRAW